MLVDCAGTQLVVGFCEPSLNLGIMTELKLVQFGGRKIPTMEMRMDKGKEETVILAYSRICVERI